MAKFRFIDWLLEFLLSIKYLDFEWDEGNSSKNTEKHGVDIDEIESVFNDKNLLALGEQVQPVVTEVRYGILGSSINSEIIFVCFTIRGGRIRVISSRFANKKERSRYGKEIC